MTEALVLDSSALLTIVFSEPGEKRVSEIVGAALISAVNLSEAAAKMNERGFDADETHILLSSLGFDVVSFGESSAYEAGKLRNITKQFGLSFGDRACLALAKSENATVITADRAWAELDLALEIEMLR